MPNSFATQNQFTFELSYGNSFINSLSSSSSHMQDLNSCSFCGKAVVDEAIRPGKTGRVRFEGLWWYAQCQQGITIAPGETVDVVGVNNITLVVKPILSESRL